MAASQGKSVVIVLARVLFSFSQVQPELTKVNSRVHYFSITCNKMKTIKYCRLLQTDKQATTLTDAL